MTRATVSLLTFSVGLLATTIPAHAGIIAAPQLTLSCLSLQTNPDNSVSLTCKVQSTGARNGELTPVITHVTLQYAGNGVGQYPLNDLSSGDIDQQSITFPAGTYVTGITFSAFGVAADVIYGDIFAYPAPPPLGQFLTSNTLQVTDHTQPPVFFGLGSCTYEGTLSTAPLNFLASGLANSGPAYVVVDTETQALGNPTGCPWSLTTVDGAANIATIDNHGATVVGPGEGHFTVLPNIVVNGNTNPRTYAVHVVPATPAGVLPPYIGEFSFTQDGLTCGYSASGFNLPQAGYTSISPGSVSIIATSPLCKWSITSASPLLSILQGIGTVFTGSATINYTLAANNTPNPITLQFSLGTALTVQGTQPGIQTTITLQTNPPAQQVVVDGVPYFAPQTLQWAPGSQHTLSATSPQAPVGGTQEVFSSWSQGGLQSQTIIAPSSATTYTANFVPQYALTTAVSPANAGTVTPSSGSFYNPGSSVSLVATASAGYVFSSWQGPVTSPSTASSSILMSSPQSVTAVFVPSSPITITVQAAPVPVVYSVDGTSYTGLQTFQWAPGSTHQINAQSPQSLLGGSYSLASGPVSMTVTPTIATTYSFIYARSGRIGPPVSVPINQPEPGSTDPFEFDVPLPDGDYLVDLTFAAQTVGTRLFNVAINGLPALTNFDPANVGDAPFKDIHQKLPVKVSNGQLAIAFHPIRDAATIKAIEVIPQPAAMRIDSRLCTGTILRTSAPIGGTQLPDIYQSACSSASDFGYNLGLPNGDYLARLRFAEIVYDGPGHRQFDVSVNGRQLLSHFDPALAAGGSFAAVDRQFLVVADRGLKIRFDPWRDAPIVSAIEILPTTVIRMKPGTNGSIDSDGQLWSGDYNYSGGDPVIVNGRTGRGGSQPFEYNFPVINGEYEVRVDWSGEAALSVNGQAAPAHSGKTTIPVSVVDGRLAIRFAPTGSLASMEAVEVLPRR